MKNKKFLALALAGAMTFSIAAPALAADLPEGWTCPHCGEGVDAFIEIEV